jgi:hypothetical protein
MNCFLCNKDIGYNSNPKFSILSCSNHAEHVDYYFAGNNLENLMIFSPVSSSYALVYVSVNIIDNKLTDKAEVYLTHANIEPTCIYPLPNPVTYDSLFALIDRTMKLTAFL